MILIDHKPEYICYSKYRKMKKIHVYLLSFLVSGSLFFSSCSDDSTPGEGGSTTSKNCKITKSTDDDGETSTYTYDGDNLVKIETKDDFGTYTTIFVYENGKLKQVEEDMSTIFELVWSGDVVTRVNMKDYDDKELYGYIIYKRSGGKLNQVDVYEVNEAPESDSIVERYDITYNGSNVSKVEIQERGDAGLESTGSISVTGVDDKNNPYYMMPTLFTSDYDDVSVLNKNNITSASLITPFGPLPFSVAYEYNADGYPTKSTSSALGETTVSTHTYDCK